MNIKYKKKGRFLDKKLLIQISIRELHNNLIKSPPEGDFSGPRYLSGCSIIGDPTLRKYMSPKEEYIKIVTWSYVDVNFLFRHP